MSVSRKASTKLLQLIEDGMIDKDYVITMCLNALSEDDVVEMCDQNDISFEDDN